MLDLSNQIRTVRDNLLDKLLAILHDDDRVRAAWLSGSFGRGTEDDWSDIDLHVAVADEAFDGWLTERNALYARIGTPILIRPDKPSNAGDGPYQGVLLAGPIFLDLNVHPASVAKPGVDCRILFDRLPLPPHVSPPLGAAERAGQIEDAIGRFWKMTPIALKYVARGRTDLAMIQSYLLLESFVTAWRLVNDPDRLQAGGAYWLHPMHDAALAARLPRFGETISRRDVLDVITHLMREMDGIAPACAEIGAVIPNAASAGIWQFRDAIDAHLDESERERSRT